MKGSPIDRDDVTSADIYNTRPFLSIKAAILRVIERKDRLTHRELKARLKNYDGRQSGYHYNLALEKLIGAGLIHFDTSHHDITRVCKGCAPSNPVKMVSQAEYKARSFAPTGNAVYPVWQD